MGGELALSLYWPDLSWVTWGQPMFTAYGSGYTVPHIDPRGRHGTRRLAVALVYAALKARIITEA